MSLERNEGRNGPITFCCDSCGDVHDTELSDFTDALNDIKGEGWVARKIGEDWVHLCEECRNEPA